VDHRILVPIEQQAPRRLPVPACPLGGVVVAADVGHNAPCYPNPTVPSRQRVKIANVPIPMRGRSPLDPGNTLLSRLTLFMVGALVSLGCYHTTIETGKPAAPETIDRLMGVKLRLLPSTPKHGRDRPEVPERGRQGEDAAHLPQRGGLASDFWHLHTMAIQVTCAAKSAADPGAVIRAGEDGETAAELVQRAAELSWSLDAPVMVEFR